MVADESDGRDDELFCASCRLIANHITDVGFQPGIGGFAAAALVRNEPICMSEFFRDQARACLQLFHVR